MHRFDLLPKIVDEYRIGTVSGGALSILAVIVSIYLCISEISAYLHPPIRQRLLVDTRKPIGPDGETISPQYQSGIEINVQITFPVAPCYLLHFDAIESFTELPLPLDHTEITFNRLSGERGQIIGTYDPAIYETAYPGDCGSCYNATNGPKCCDSCRAVLDAYEEDEMLFPDLSVIAQCAHLLEKFKFMDSEGCEVTASYRTLRIKSEFHISPGMSSVLDGVHFHDLAPFGRSWPDMNLTHTIDKLTFGIDDVPGPLTNFTTVQTTSGSWRVLYVTDVIADEYTAERYVMTQGSNVFPGVTIRYDISPLFAVSYYEREGVLQLLTRLIMLIGAIIFLFRILDSALNWNGKGNRVID
jgi:hypothetical protein